MSAVSQQIRQHHDNLGLHLHIGFMAVLLFVFFYISRLLELTVPYLRIPLILSGVYLAIAGISGRIMQFLNHTAGKAVIGFYVCILISFPFSVWKGGSLETVTETGRMVIMMIGLAALIMTVAQSIKVMHAIGYAVVAAALLSFWAGAKVDGRLILELGTYADPNSFAMSLLIGLPFLYLKVQNSRNVLVKLAICGGMVIVLGVVAQTGSRSGLITLIGMGIILFLRLPMRGKFAMLLLATVAILLAPLIVSDHLKGRYMTLLEDKTGFQAVAAGSGAARAHLFWQSVYLTFSNPIVGVGPGMFAVAENSYSLENLGSRGSWHGTHNAYTQISSECGIPALLFYVTALGSTLLVPWRILKAIPQNSTGNLLEIRNAAIALELSLVAFSIFSCFLSVAYDGTTFVLMGISSCFGCAVAPLLARQQKRSLTSASVSGARTGSFAGGKYNPLPSTISPTGH